MWTVDGAWSERVAVLRRDMELNLARKAPRRQDASNTARKEHKHPDVPITEI